MFPTQSEILSELRTIDDKCRTCLLAIPPTNNPNPTTLISIFENQLIHGQPICFAEMISCCTALDIQFDDVLPKFICQICSIDIIGAFTFRQKALNSDFLLRYVAAEMTTLSEDVSSLEQELESSTPKVRRPHKRKRLDDPGRSHGKKVANNVNGSAVAAEATDPNSSSEISVVSGEKLFTQVRDILNQGCSKKMPSVRKDEVARNELEVTIVPKIKVEPPQTEHLPERTKPSEINLLPELTKIPDTVISKNEILAKRDELDVTVVPKIKVESTNQKVPEPAKLKPDEVAKFPELTNLLECKQLPELSPLTLPPLVSISERKAQPSLSEAEEKSQLKIRKLSELKKILSEELNKSFNYMQKNNMKRAQSLEPSKSGTAEVDSGSSEIKKKKSLPITIKSVTTLNKMAEVELKKAANLESHLVSQKNDQKVDKLEKISTAGKSPEIILNPKVLVKTEVEKSPEPAEKPPALDGKCSAVDIVIKSDKAVSATPQTLQKEPVIKTETERFPVSLENKKSECTSEDVVAKSEVQTKILSEEPVVKTETTKECLSSTEVPNPSSNQSDCKTKKLQMVEALKRDLSKIGDKLRCALSLATTKLTENHNDNSPLLPILSAVQLNTSDPKRILPLEASQPILDEYSDNLDSTIRDQDLRQMIRGRLQKLHSRSRESSIPPLTTISSKLPTNQTPTEENRNTPENKTIQSSRENPKSPNSQMIDTATEEPTVIIDDDSTPSTTKCPAPIQLPSDPVDPDGIKLVIPDVGGDQEEQAAEEEEEEYCLVEVDWNGDDDEIIILDDDDDENNTNDSEATVEID